MIKIDRIPLRLTLVFIGAMQLIFGAMLSLAPAQFGATFGFEGAPAWVYWMFAGAGGRSLVFAYGMFLAARQAERYLPWIQGMIGVQPVDWLATLYGINTGAFTLAQAGMAAVLPLIFVALLLVFYPRKQTSTLKTLAQPDTHS